MTHSKYDTMPILTSPEQSEIFDDLTEVLMKHNQQPVHVFMGLLASFSGHCTAMAEQSGLEYEQIMEAWKLNFSQGYCENNQMKEAGETEPRRH